MAGTVIFHIASTAIGPQKVIMTTNNRTYSPTGGDSESWWVAIAMAYSTAPATRQHTAADPATHHSTRRGRGLARRSVGSRARTSESIASTRRAGTRHP